MSETTLFKARPAPPPPAARCLPPPRGAAGPGPPLLARRWLRWGLVFCLWTAVALIEAGQTYFLSELLYDANDPYPRRRLSLEQCLMLSLSCWYSLAALSPLLIALAHSYPFELRRWKCRL